jgi:hypothetical protein
VCSRNASIVGYAELIRAEYRESPGLRLTKGEIERLWRLDALTSAAVLAVLVESRVLRLTAAGAYVRADAGDEVPTRPMPPRRRLNARE